MKRVLALLSALLLLTLPACGASQAAETLFQVDDIGWVVLDGGPEYGKCVTIKGDDLDRFKETLVAMNFQRAKKIPDVGPGWQMVLFGPDGRELIRFTLRGEDCIEYEGWRYDSREAAFDLDWLAERIQKLPESSYDECRPWKEFWSDGEPRYIELWVNTPHWTDVTITDPALMAEIREMVGSMEYHAAGEELLAYDSYLFSMSLAYKGGIWAEMIFIMDSDSVKYMFGLYETVGGEFDLDWLTDLCDPDGSFAGRPGVYYWQEGKEMPVIPELEDEP